MRAASYSWICVVLSERRRSKRTNERGCWRNPKPRSIEDRGCLSVWLAAIDVRARLGKKRIFSPLLCPSKRSTNQLGDEGHVRGSAQPWEEEQEQEIIQQQQQQQRGLNNHLAGKRAFNSSYLDIVEAARQNKKPTHLGSKQKKYHVQCVSLGSPSFGSLYSKI